jgi:hypothetical protein
MAQQNRLVNNFASTLSADITSAAASITLAATTGLPTLSGGQYLYITLQSAGTPSKVEVVKVTGISGQVLTVVRGQDVTTAQAFVTGDYAKLSAVAGNFNDLYSYVDGAVAGSVTTFEGRTGAVALQASDLVGAVVATSTGGTSDAITATFSPAITALVDGLTVMFKGASSNTSAAPTFTPNSGVIGALPIKAYRGGALGSVAAGAITAGAWITLTYSASANAWLMLNAATEFGVTLPNTDDSTYLATTQFVKNVTGYRRVKFVGAGQTLTLSDADLGYTVYANSPGAAMTVVLPPKASVTTGWRITIVLTSNTTLTIQTPNGDASYLYRPVYGQTQSIVVNRPGAIEVTYDAGSSTWFAISGSYSYDLQALQNRVMTPNGRQEIPYGMLMQWGQQTLPANTEAPQTYSYPVAFPNACLQIVGNKATPWGSAADGNVCGAINLSAAQYQLYNDAAASNYNPVVTWIAIGC